MLLFMLGKDGELEGGGERLISKPQKSTAGNLLHLGYQYQSIGRGRKLDFIHFSASRVIFP